MSNELWLSFVSEWIETSKERHALKAGQTYKKAYKSLKDCPMEFQHPSELSALHGWGEKLCKKMTDDLQVYCDQNNIPMPQRHKKRKKTMLLDENGDLNSDAEEETTPKKKKRIVKAKPYIPKFRTGPYAIVLALSTLDEDATEGLLKQEVIALARPHSDSSFDVPSDGGQFYTAWASINTLKAKDVVYEKGRPTRYLLSETGWDVAKSIRLSSDASQGRMGTFVSAKKTTAGSDDESGGDGTPRRRSTAGQPSESPKKPGAIDIVPQGTPISSPNQLPIVNPIILEPGSFTVELVLDIREVRAKSDRDYMQKHLTEKGVTPIMRALALGDVLWVAKLHDPNLLSRRGAEGSEVLLDYIVERKRLDDLVGSIKDGRFHEQKFRLRRSGVKSVTYIIEEIRMDSDHLSKYQEAVNTAIASTQVVNGFFVKKTQKMDDTIRYLVSMTKLLKERYENKPLHLIPTGIVTSENYLPLLEHLGKTQPSTDFHITYEAFASLGSKSAVLRLRDVFLKMLMCIKGVTGEKALQIEKKWKTPYAFIDAYRKIEMQEASKEQAKKKKMDLVSSELATLIRRKSIGKAVSVKIAEVWGDVELN